MFRLSLDDKVFCWRKLRFGGRQERASVCLQRLLGQGCRPPRATCGLQTPSASCAFQRAPWARDCAFAQPDSLTALSRLDQFRAALPDKVKSRISAATNSQRLGRLHAFRHIIWPSRTRPLDIVLACCSCSHATRLTRSNHATQAVSSSLGEPEERLRQNDDNQ